MIDVGRLREVKQVLYHQSCPDGTASAMICYAAFKLLHAKRPELIPELKSVQYSTDFFEKLEPGAGQLFVDITPPRARWGEWKDTGVIVLDHHESVEEITRGLGGVYATNEAHSGARLAFEQVLTPVLKHLLSKVNEDYDAGGKLDAEAVLYLAEAERLWDEFSRLAMIRDTWKDEDPDFEKATVQAYGLMTLGSKDVLDSMKEGRTELGLIVRLGEKDLGKAKFMADSARKYEMACPKLGRTLSVAIYNCTEKKYISDGCHHLLRNGFDFAVSYFSKHQDDKTTVVVSLRSNDPIAGIIAKKMDGGGHAKAAGFGLPNGESISMDVVAAVIRAQLEALQ